MRFLSTLFLLIFFHGMPFQGWASDSTRYTMRHYTDEDGLPQNSILSINSGKGGFLWMGTEDGLVRFDGRHFFVFNKANTGLPTNRFSRITASIFDDNKYALEMDSNYLLIAAGKAIPASRFLIKTREVLAAAQCHLDRKRGDILIPVGKHVFYLISNDSITYFNNGIKRKTRFSHDRYMDKNFFLIREQLFFLLAENTVLACDINEGRKMTIKDMPFGKGQATSYRILMNTKDQQPFLISDDGLYRLNIVEGQISARKMLDKLPVPMNDIHSIHQDEGSGNIYMGTASNGLYVFQKKSFQTYTYPNTLFYAQTSLRDSLIIIPQGLVFGNQRKPERMAQFNVEEGMYGMFTDERGFIWMYENELLKLEPLTLKAVDRWKTKEPILLIAGGRNNMLWISSRAGNIYQLETKNGHDSIQHVVTLPRASFLLQEDEHKLWVGAYDALYCYHPDTKRIDTVREFAGKYVRSLYLDQEHNLWITTYEDGVFLLKHGKVVHFPYDHQESLRSAHCILEDGKGFFWITTNKGLFQVPKQDMLDYASGKMKSLFYVYYGKENGFNTNEFNGGCQPCGVKLKNGYFSMPSLNGIVWFHPEDFKTNLPDNDIFIDKIEVDGVSVPIDSQMRFDRHFEMMNIWVSTAYLGDHRNVHLYYRFVKNGTPVYWPVPDNGIISLHDLSSGNHEVEIIKNNGFGKDNVAIKKVRISIAPYWYETWWFCTLVVFGLVALFFLVTGLRTRILRQRNRWLELQIRRRTRKLEHTLDTLNASQHAQSRQAYIQQRLIAAISHDVRTPLKFLTAVNRRIYETLLKITNDNDLLEMSKAAGDASGQMQDYLSNLLQYIKTTSYQQKTTKEYVNISRLIAEQADMFRQLIKENGSQVIVSVRADLQVYTNGQLLSIILHNIIDNAAKNTFDGAIEITCTHEGGKITLAIRDTGDGVTGALVEWVNAKLVYSDEGPSTPMASKGPDGIGLFIVKELAGIIDAKVQMYSDPKTGTLVHIVLDELHPDD